MKRTKFPEKYTITVIEFYDKDKKLRLGALYERRGKGVVIKNIYGEKIHMPNEKIVSEKIIDKSRWGLERVIKL